MPIVLVSFTPAEQSGGVNRWNRDFMKMFPGARHYSWWDLFKAYPGVQDSLPEWEKAKVLSSWLLRTRKVTEQDVVIADSFWADGFDPKRTVCVRHGIWSHLTLEDVQAGKQPEFPYHHAAQVDHTRRHIDRGGHVVAVSDFISNQLKLQWGWDVPVINNSIDLDECQPCNPKWLNKAYLIIHGSTTMNKGLDHIQYLQKQLGNNVCIVSLDEAAQMFSVSKMQALARANLVVHPSAYEGNSMFVLETLACDVPIVSYDVGLMWRAKNENAQVGWIGDRKERSPEQTFKLVKDAILHQTMIWSLSGQKKPRDWVEQFSLPNWKFAWEHYLLNRGLI